MRFRWVIYGSRCGCRAVVIGNLLSFGAQLIGEFSSTVHVYNYTISYRQNAKQSRFANK